ncbi:MAG: hypothetical protein AB7N80_10020 [Bdellovibrionales bacterium]
MAAVLALSGCAFLHHQQLGDVDSDVVRKGRKFVILLSETGVNVAEAGSILKATTRHQKTQQDVGRATAIIEMFQMGPRTGNPVFTEKFADNLVDQILERCPKGRISGLASTRESAKYPVVSGEIVKITGYCYDKEGA